MASNPAELLMPVKDLVYNVRRMMVILMSARQAYFESGIRPRVIVRDLRSVDSGITESAGYIDIRRGADQTMKCNYEPNNTRTPFYGTTEMYDVKYVIYTKLLKGNPEFVIDRSVASMISQIIKAVYLVLSRFSIWGKTGPTITGSNDICVAGSKMGITKTCLPETMIQHTRDIHTTCLTGLDLIKSRTFIYAAVFAVDKKINTDVHVCHGAVRTVWEFLVAPPEYLQVKLRGDTIEKIFPVDHIVFIQNDVPIDHWRQLHDIYFRTVFCNPVCTSINAVEKIGKDIKLMIMRAILGFISFNEVVDVFEEIPPCGQSNCVCSLDKNDITRYVKMYPSLVKYCSEPVTDLKELDCIDWEGPFACKFHDMEYICGSGAAYSAPIVDFQLYGDDRQHINKQSRCNSCLKNYTINITFNSMMYSYRRALAMQYLRSID